MKEPVFLLGASRSGTTLLRLMLNAHPNIAIPAEQDYFPSLPVPAETWTDPPLSDTAYEQFVTEHLKRNTATLPGLDLPSVRASILQSTVAPTLRIPYEIPLYTWMRSQGKQRWGENTPENVFFVDVLDEMFPEARYIHLVRDPRAAVHSMNQSEQYGTDTAINATNWCEFISRGAVLLEQIVPEGRRLPLFYEDVTAHPRSAAERICAFLDEPLDSKMIDVYEKANVSESPNDNQLGRANGEARPETNRALRPKWVDEMPNDQIAIVESICEEQMDRYGYESTGLDASLRARADQYLKLTYVAAKRLQHAEDRFHVINYPPFLRLHRFRTTLPTTRRTAHTMN